MWTWISVALLSIVLTVGLLAILVNLKKKAGAGARPPNHRAFFFMGVVMLAAGTAELLMFLRSDVSFVVALPLTGDRAGVCGGWAGQPGQLEQEVKRLPASDWPIAACSLGNPASL